MLSTLYRDKLALATDLYQLTMAHGYWRAGMQEHDAVFNLFFRQAPFGGGYTVACGLNYVLDYLRDFRFTADDLAYLRTLTGADGQALFDPDFITALGTLELACDVDAVAEGSVVFPHMPLLRVRGPLLQAQLLETALLNMVNFQTLIATKAARVCRAAQGEPVLEFGLRRAQGLDGAMAASWASYVGGCAATSNVLAGKYFGIPVKGTHAHSWVMCFDSEPEAFAAYAQAMPNNVVLLVDTYDTLQGVKHAIAVGRELEAQGRKLLGIRLDSGDLAWLSQRARELLDAAGFTQTAIVASSDLDEYAITRLKDDGARIGVWGVGTRLVTAYDQPALGGVYKLSAIRAPGGDWQPRLKLSEQTIKVSTPGLLRVRRFRGPLSYVADMTYDETLGVSDPPVLVDPADPTHLKTLTGPLTAEELLQPMFRAGRPVIEAADAQTARDRVRRELDGFDRSITRLSTPYPYPAGLELRLHERKQALILQARYGEGGGRS